MKQINDCFKVEISREGEINLFLQKLPELRRFHSVECALSVYPLIPALTAEDFEVAPYEDYVDELVAGRRSTYVLVKNATDKFFGVLVGLVIAGVFLWLAPQLLFSVEAVVAVMGAYAIGKEAWTDIDDALAGFTKHRAWRWAEQDFFYVREDFGSLQRFWQYARQERYGFRLTLPTMIDVIGHSNSKTVEMLFTADDLSSAQQRQVRIASILLKPTVKEKVTLKQLMIVFKLTLRKRALFGFSVVETYQALVAGKGGTVDASDTWHSQAMLQKPLREFGKFHWVGKTRVVNGQIVKLG
jgi:hypothetical protein